jgi:hypothetical protein
MPAIRARHPGRWTDDGRKYEVPRHLLRVPPERRDQQAFVYDPQTGYVVAPWPRGRSTPDDERRLAAVFERIEQIADDYASPVWIWPDGREPVPVAAVDLRGWLMHWSRDRACYLAGAVSA